MNLLLRREIEEFSSRKGPVAIITHKQADLDAVASSVALKHFLISSRKRNEKEVFLIFPEGISKEAEESIKKCGLDQFNFSTEADPYLLRSSLLIILDTASPTQLPEDILNIILGKEDVFLIDHHFSNTLKEVVPNYYWDANATSLSEIIAEIFFDEELKGETSKALMIGILADTGRFSRGSHTTFSAMGRLAKFSDYEVAKRCLARPQEDRSIRIARLKALQRMIVESFKDAIVVATYVSSFESDVADFLIRGGSDASIVVSPKKDEFRVIIKFREELNGEIKEKILEAVERILGTKRAGHKDMAVIAVKKKIEKKEAQKLISNIRRELQLVLK